MTTQSQLNAILHGAAFAPITDRAFLRITGSDATRWLNGMVTNNIKDLAPGEGNYNFLLNAQGRIQGDCTIYREPGEGDAKFLLETGNWQLETVHQTLDKFIIMDDVELAHGIPIDGTQPEPSPLGIAITGFEAANLLTRVIEGRPGNVYLAPEPGSMTYGSLEGHKVIVLTQRHANITTFEVWCSSRGAYKELYRQLEFFNTPTLSPETLEAFRIYSGTPKYGIDIRDRDLPQETAQTHALHFAKGCYLGQEIVERIRSRGQVHRTFTRFTLTGSLPTELPASLEARNSEGQAKPAGEITSATQIGDTIYALGYARREALDTHATLTYPGGTATPLNPKP
jgi:folate-binding protein YgfZ